MDILEATIGTTDGNRISSRVSQGSNEKLNVN